MTRFSVGDVLLPNAEAALLREYYWWGQWKERKGELVDPPWEEASIEQRRRVVLRGYSMYDGLPCYPGDLIGPEECYASVGMNSFLTILDAVRLVSRAEEVRPLLAAVPEDRPLEDGRAEELRALAELIDCLSTSHQIGPAKVTKVVHKKRPAFVPILDSVVVQCLREHFLPLSRRWPSYLESLTAIQTLLLEKQADLAPIQVGLLTWGIRVSRVRLLDFCLWTWKTRYPDLPA